MPSQSIRYAHVAALLFFALCQPAKALIVYGSTDHLDPTDLNYDDTYLNAPSDGAPWDYVARVSPDNPSAVYLGHGFLLTAEHLNKTNEGIEIAGQDYARDLDFEPIHVTTGSDWVDLSLWKIVGDPQLPELPIALPDTDADLGKETTLIAYGVGKGTYVSGGTGSGFFEGWTWGTQIKKKRWGTNVTDGDDTSIDPDVSYRVLRFYQNLNAVASEAALASGDSGAGFFQSFGGTWKLAGIATLADNPSYFQIGDEYVSEGVRLSVYSHLLRFENWKVAVAGNLALDELSDGDGDGIALLMEYAMGMKPDEESSTQRPTVEISGSQVTITYRRLMSASDIEFVVEESGNLVDWEPATLANHEKIAQDGTVWIWKDSVELGSEIEKYLRVRVKRLVDPVVP